MVCIPRCFGPKTTFIAMIAFTTSFFFVEIIVGYATNSMALVADSFHMLSDIVSLLVGFFAVQMSQKAKQTSSNNTFGWARAEVLGALVNSVFLIALCFSIAIEALKRIISPEPINDPILVLIVGAAGLFVNLVGMLLFHGHLGHGHSHSHGSHGQTHPHCGQERNNTCPSDVDAPDEGLLALEDSVTLMENKQEGVNTNEVYQAVTVDIQKKQKKTPKTSGQMNMKGVYLHLLGDAMGSVIVIVCAVLIHFFKAKWTLYIDPAMSMVMVIIILKSSISLMKESSCILLQHVPSHIEVKQIENKLLGAFPQIVGVHEFHVWQLVGHKIVASLHIKCMSNGDYQLISDGVKEFFHQEGIHSTTVQPEFIQNSEKISEEQECLVRCIDKACQEKLCCGNKKDR